MQNTANVPRRGGSVLTDPKLRALIFQLLVIAAVVGLGWYLFDNTQTNLEQRGITSGFAFLNNTAGFGIAQHLIDYTQTDSYGRVPRQSLGVLDSFYLNSRGLYMPSPGLSETFGLFFAALLLAVVASVFLGRWARKRRETTGQPFPVLVSVLALLLIIPGAAVLIAGNPLVWTVPELSGFNFAGGWVLIPELIALTLALSIYTAAFIAEIVRAGIQSVSHGQTEAAHSLGLPAGKTLRLVIIPQALRVIIPPLTSQYLNLAKNSSLAAGIGYPDMVSLFAGTVLNQTGQAIEVIAITMSVYLAISISISLFMNWYNGRIALIER